MHTADNPLTRSVALAYAGIAYASFVLAAAWAVGFLAGRGAPTSVDGPVRVAAWQAVLVDLGLLGLFAVQHSVMAREGVKARLSRVMPPGLERSTFVLATGLVLLLLFWQWEPLRGTVWDLDGPVLRALVWAVFGAGWAIAVAATFMVDHLDFLGLRQAVGHVRGRPPTPPPFGERRLYAWVRHPMMLGLLLAFWATPTMSTGHLLFAVAASGYIAVGLHFEERDLRRQLGRTYEDYAARVPAVLPRPGRAPSG